MAEFEEVELRAYNQDLTRTREQLMRVGAVALSDGPVKQSRAVLDTIPSEPDRWIRVRSDGTKTTLAVKDRRAGAVDGEAEVVVDDFDTTLEVLKRAGLPAPRSLQENFRETYELHGHEVTIDLWPRLGPIVEIEAPTEEEIRVLFAEIGVAPEDVTDMPIEQFYSEHHDIDPRVTNLTFDGLEESFAS